jgi:DNA-binding NtrC family response regulator
VDDEPSIRLTLPPVLAENGFEVRVAGSVPEALLEINSHSFDVLLSDLNIGEEGDGFLVVSAMRHLQPDCINLILTGYPAFETALQAIHNQVDDYLIKPADVDSLIATVKDKLVDRSSKAPATSNRLAAVLKDNSKHIAAQMLDAAKHDAALSTIRLSDDERIDHLPKLLAMLVETLQPGQKGLSKETIRLAVEHGKKRRHQGYTIPMVITEYRYVNNVIYDLVQSQLAPVDAGGLISEMRLLQNSIYSLMEKSLEPYLTTRSSTK